ncbi:carbonic anhydrase [Nocardioides luteus]|uniref:carbonic anhydrase n=1 Tax=Nocardioides luteus TaxID=1844 RepID=UPI000A7812CD|nr:carbonic anhydrase [Nocardioides luteus]
MLGSVEYGTGVLEAPLVVVLGHDSGGAVAAACTALDGGTTPSGFVRDVVERVTPSVLTARMAGHTQAEEIIDEHIGHTVELLLDRSRVGRPGRLRPDGRGGLVLPPSRTAGSARRVADRGLGLPAN